jgi:hypothetical protein
MQKKAVDGEAGIKRRWFAMAQSTFFAKGTGR